jgi:hypothetical protein
LIISQVVLPFAIGWSARLSCQFIRFETGFPPASI